MLHLQPGFSWTDTSVRDASGVTQSSDSRQYSGVYQLSFDKSLYENFALAGSGTFQDTRSWLTSNGSSLDSQARVWSGDARLSVGPQSLRGGVGYQRQDSSTSSQSSADPFLVVQPSVKREVWQAFGLVAPDELPSLEARLTRDSLQTAGTNLTTSTAAATSRYLPNSSLSLIGSVQYTDSHDQGNDVVQKSWQEDLSGQYRGSPSARSNVFVQGNLTHRSNDLFAGSSSGQVKTQRFPIEGLSLTEAPADTPEQDVLKVNAAIIDGDLRGATGINIGFGPTLAADSAFRDVGVHSVELQPVNLLEVWVDKRLSFAASSSYVFTVYQSDNNRDWTRVELAGAVTFDAAETRFNIPIASVVSPYLKVVTRPLSITATPEASYRDVLVTELRVYYAQNARELQGRSSTTGASMSGSYGYRLLDVPNLRYDLSVLAASTDWKEPTLQIRNGLSASQQLSSVFTVAGNVARLDTRDIRGHEGQLLWGGSLNAVPLPTLTSGFSYGGYYAQTVVGSELNNGFSLYSRAALYRGVDVSANAGYNLSTRSSGTTRSLTVSGSTTIAPYTWMTLTGGVLAARVTSPGTEGQARESSTTRFDGALTVTPFPALFLSAGVARYIATGITPTTIYNVTGTYSPFREGTLLMSVGHSETFEPAKQTRDRLTSASIRWNITTSVNTEGGWSVIDGEDLQTSTHSQSVGIRLTVTM